MQRWYHLVFTMRDPAAPAEPLLRVSATDAAYAAIREEILTAKLRPGDPVPIERFLRELGLSKTPVREAILRLQREQLVEVRPRFGTFVSHLDLRQIREMYQVRGALEGLAARLAALRGDTPEAQTLARVLKSQNLSAPQLDLKAISEAGQEVHRYLVSSCGNALLERQVQGLQDHFARFRHLSLGIREKVLVSHREHVAILSAVRSGNGDVAEHRVREHFAGAMAKLIENLLDESATGSVVIPIDRRGALPR